jgi:hypothetical protein
MPVGRIVRPERVLPGNCPARGSANHKAKKSIRFACGPASGRNLKRGVIVMLLVAGCALYGLCLGLILLLSWRSLSTHDRETLGADAVIGSLAAMIAMGLLVSGLLVFYESRVLTDAVGVRAGLIVAMFVGGVFLLRAGLAALARIRAGGKGGQAGGALGLPA